MTKKLKNYEVLVKALKNFSLVNLDVNILRKGENVLKKIKETSSKVFVYPYLSFIEENGERFDLRVEDDFKAWDGTMYYSTDGKTWNVWSGEGIYSSNDGKLFIRGKNNTVVSKGVTWALPPDKRVQCQGNIENLLDYEVVGRREHPQMAKECYKYMFYNCKSLTQAPELPATTLTTECYSGMFTGCTSLTQAPELPATTLALYCYKYMFSNCESLTQAPELPATTLTSLCYQNMFDGCTSLTQAPKLPATTLARDCYKSIFKNCKNLTGTIHCPKSTANDSNRLDATAQIPTGTATVVYDL